MWSKFAEVQCAFAVAEVRKVTANLSQTCGFAVAEHLLQFCGICGCGIECKFAVPSSAHFKPNFFPNVLTYFSLENHLEIQYLLHYSRKLALRLKFQRFT